MVTGLSNDLSYSEKLKLLGHQSLEGRRLKLMSNLSDEN